MNVEARMTALEANCRNYRIALLGMIGVLALVVTAGAQYFNAGDTLMTPVQIKSPSETVLITINEKGVIEFYGDHQVVARLSGLSLHDIEDTLKRQDYELAKINQSLQEHRSVLNAHERSLKVMEVHLRQPVYRGPGR